MLQLWGGKTAQHQLMDVLASHSQKLSFQRFSYNFFLSVFFIELDDGKIYRKALYLMVKTHGFPVKIFP